MTNQSVEQAVRSAIKLEIGDDESITFKQKNILGQKFGLTAPVISAEEIAYWEMREKVGDNYVRR
jgi:hypothetical protein